MRKTWLKTLGKGHFKHFPSKLHKKCMLCAENAQNSAKFCLIPERMHIITDVRMSIPHTRSANHPWRNTPPCSYGHPITECPCFPVGFISFFCRNNFLLFFYARRACMPPLWAFPSLRGHFTCYFSLKMREKIAWIAQIAQNTIPPVIVPFLCFQYSFSRIKMHPSLNTPPLWIFPSNKRRL